MNTHLDFDQLLLHAREQRASDLLVSAGSPPAIRVDGLIRLLEGPALDGERTRTMVCGLLTHDQVARLEAERELDFSAILDGHRYRGNAYWQAGTVAAAFRLIPDTIPEPDALGIPRPVLDFIRRPQGLLLITGASDQGKTTTQASLVDHLNRTMARHIITIEDPVEFVHPNRLSIVDQRELGSDTLSFAEALRHALRQSPDVILVGEMRDADTVRAALAAAETGHLVLSTLHTNDAAQALDRMIQFFTEVEQAQVRAQLSMSLLAVVAQRLVRDRVGRLVLATEILHNSHAVANVIRDGRMHQVYSVMEASRGQGMQTMSQALEALVRQGRIAEAEARRYVSVHESLQVTVPAP